MTASNTGSNDKWVRVSARAHHVIAEVRKIANSIAPEGLNVNFKDAMDFIITQWLNGRSVQQAMVEQGACMNVKATHTVQSVSEQRHD